MDLKYAPYIFNISYYRSSYKTNRIFLCLCKSTAVGIVSMVPGGLGTFDLTFIYGFKALGVPIEQTFLVIILYRISYFILPAAIGVILYIPLSLV